mgnify:CR=1 FL=1
MAEQESNGDDERGKLFIDLLSGEVILSERHVTRMIEDCMYEVVGKLTTVLPRESEDPHAHPLNSEVNRIAQFTAAQCEVDVAIEFQLRRIEVTRESYVKHSKVRG